MKSFVDIELLLNKNMVIKKNLYKSNLIYKEQAELMKKKCVDEAIIVDRLKAFTTEKKIDFKKLLEHISDMEMQYKNFAQVRLFYLKRNLTR